MNGGAMMPWHQRVKAWAENQADLILNLILLVGALFFVLAIVLPYRPLKYVGVLMILL